MITSIIARLPKSAVEITSTIPNSDIKAEYETTMTKIVADFEMPGFRKGKASREVVEKNVDREKTASIVIQNLLPKAYEEAVEKNSLKPIVDPKIEIIEPKEKFEEILNSSDLKVKFFTAERPDIQLKDYKEKIKTSTAKEAIWTPDKAAREKPDKEESREIKDQKKFMNIVDLLAKTCVVEMAEIVIEAETNRILSQTLEEIKKLGLSLEEYLRNTSKTAEGLKAEAKTRAESSLKMSFIFDEIAKIEKISVDKADIDAVIAKVQDKAQKAEIEKNAYQLAPVLLRQKVESKLIEK